MSLKPHKDQIYIEALLNNNSRILSELYTRFTPKIIAYVKKNSGNEEQANDLIQEVLVTIFHQAKDKGFILTCPFDAYFFLLCKRKWFNILKKKSYNEVTIEDDFLSISDKQEEQAMETERYEMQSNLFEEKFQELGAKCKELLKLSFTVKSMEKVAEALNISYGYARKKKSQCMSQLTKLIKTAASFKTIKNY
jgi:RNA polymerase sigma factor (sigma-70 family)